MLEMVINCNLDVRNGNSMLEMVIQMLEIVIQMLDIFWVIN